MDYIFEGLKKAYLLIISCDKEMFSIVMVSMKVAFISTLLAAVTGVPAGFIIAVKEFKGKKILVTILNTLMSLPTVVVGLTVYSFISRRGPLGDFRLLFTQEAMIIGQMILAFPIISALSLSAVNSVDTRVEKTALTLGAGKYRTAFLILMEGRDAVLCAVIAGFGRVFAEVGVSMMLGGNIRGYTRNITTAIAFETGKGEFGMGIALGVILVSIAFCINILFYYFQKKKR